MLYRGETWRCVSALDKGAREQSLPEASWREKERERKKNLFDCCSTSVFLQIEEMFTRWLQQCSLARNAKAAALPWSVADV